MKYPSGLKARILALLLGGLALPVILLGVGAYWYLSTFETTTRMEQYLADVALLTMRQIDAVLDRAAAATRSLAVDGAIVGALEAGGASNEAALTEHLNELVGYLDVAELLVVVDIGGRLVAVNDPRPGDWQISSSPLSAGGELGGLEPEWVGPTLAGSLNAPGLQKVNRSKSGLAERLGAHGSGEGEDSYFVRYAAPVRSGGEIIGAVCIFLPWHRVQVDIMDRVAEDFAAAGYDTGYAYMMDADGRTIIGHARREFYGTDVVSFHGLPSVWKAILAGERHHTYEFPENTWKIAGLATSQSTYGFGWTIGTGIDFPDIYEHVKQVGVAYGLAVLVLTIVTSLIAVRMVR
ncbi:MAG: cache domain-containing protein [Acidobacteriota bacterium]